MTQVKERVGGSCLCHGVASGWCQGICRISSNILITIILGGSWILQTFIRYLGEVNVMSLLGWVELQINKCLEVMHLKVFTYREPKAITGSSLSWARPSPSSQEYFLLFLNIIFRFLQPPMVPAPRCAQALTHAGHLAKLSFLILSSVPDSFLKHRLSSPCISPSLCCSYDFSQHLEEL